MTEKQYWEKDSSEYNWYDFSLFWEDNFNWFRESILNRKLLKKRGIFKKIKKQKRKR